MAESPSGTLILGIGNVLMGDEGVGVAVARQMTETAALPPGVECIDGGTGSFTLLSVMREAKRIILIDATVDGLPPGSVRRLQPRFASEYPRSLTAHDIGLRDLLDTFHILGDPPPVVLYTVSIAGIHDLSLDLSPEVAAAVPEVSERILAELNGSA